jgi:hypothetical protein
MTAMAFLDTSHVKCVDTQRLFFGRFAYSFTVPFLKEDLLEIATLRHRGEYTEALDAKVIMQRTTLEMVFGIDSCPKDAEYRIHAKAIIFYTDEAQQFENFVRSYQHLISKVSRPLVDAAVLSEQGVNTLVRERNFFNKYPVRVQMKWMWDTDALDAIVEEHFDDSETSYYNYGDTRVLYLTTTAGMIKARLLLNNYISRVEKIRLVSEL